MKRLLATIRCDLRLQWRNGFYYATAFVVLIWVAILSQVPRVEFGWLLAPVVSGNLVLTTFYFVGGLVLLEKGEGTLEAQVVTPLRTWEYLSAKVATLGMLALIENVLLVALAWGLGFGAVPLILGIALAAAMYVLAGFVVVARYRSINEYLMPSVIYTALLTLPLFPALGRWDHWLFYLHPLYAPLVVMQASFQQVEFWLLVYGVLYSGLWIALAYLWSQRAFRRYLSVGGGSG